MDLPKIVFRQQTNSCPICKGKAFMPFGGRDHFDWRIEYKICKHCGMIVQDPSMDAETAEWFYKTQYRELYNGNSMPTDKEKDIQRRRAENQVLFLKSYLKANKIAEHGSYLDIGCSTGEHLMQVRKHLPEMRLTGIEPGDGYRKHCESLGVEVFENDTDAVKSGEKYDIINLSHVLEHIPTPIQYLAYLKKELLKPDGVLLLEVPNTIGGHGAFEIAHPICFISKTLQDTLSLSGFDKVQITKHSVTKEEYKPKDMYLLAASRNSSNSAKHRLRSVNPWLVKFQRRRGYRRESLIQSVKVLLKDYLKRSN